MIGKKQLNVDLPDDLVDELKAYAQANRQLLRYVVEDMLRAGLSSGRPGPAKRGKVTIPKKKPRRTTSVRANHPEQPMKELQS